MLSTIVLLCFVGQSKQLSVAFYSLLENVVRSGMRLDLVRRQMSGQGIVPRTPDIVYHNGQRRALRLIFFRHNCSNLYCISPECPVPTAARWCVPCQEEEFHKLILSLDTRGKREGELRQVLQERFDIAELERNVKDRYRSCLECQKNLPSVDVVGLKQ